MHIQNPISEFKSNTFSSSGVHSASVARVWRYRNLIITIIITITRLSLRKQRYISV